MALGLRYSAMANKTERQGAIREIVETKVVESQDDLRKLLRQRGWDVTQSTLSRDLREMRLARISSSSFASSANGCSESKPTFRACVRCLSSSSAEMIDSSMYLANPFGPRRHASTILDGTDSEARSI